MPNTTIFFTTLPATDTYTVVISAFSTYLADPFDSSSGPGDQAFAYLGSAAFTDTAGELRFAGHLLQGDIDGDGTADFSIHVNASTLAVADFVL